MTHEHLTAWALPPLPLDNWEDTKETLHRYCQIAGKVRMELSPFRNHWWHVTLYVTTRGLSTGPIPYGPYGSATFDISFDLLENKLAMTTKPFGLDDEYMLDDNTLHCVCEQKYVRRYHRVLLWVDRVFEEFAGRFAGKTSPVQLYWHSFDLAVTRFSGKQVSLPEGTDPVTREAYSYEVISFGFWPGDTNVREPAFYSYTAPEPEGLTEHPLSPEGASWLPEGGMALLTYEQVRNTFSPKETLLEFMESAYQAGAKSAGWDIEALWTHPPARDAAKLRRGD